MKSATAPSRRFRLLSLVIGTVIAMGASQSLFAQQQQARQQQPAAPQANQPKQIKTLAVVNGKAISRQQVANECIRRFGNDVLKSVINKQLVFAECQKRGINITEKDVNDEIILRAQKFKMSGNDYVKLITNRRNISAERLKNDVVWSEIALRRLAATQLKVSQKEINERIEFEFGPRVQVREIAMKSAEDAQRILAEVKAGADFGTLAKNNSVNPNSASVRGLLPPIRRNSGLPQFEEVAFSLQPGQISNVFQIEDRFIILQCERLMPQAELTQEQLTEANTRITDELENSKLAEAASALFENLRQTSKIQNVMNDPELKKQMPGVVAIVNGQQITRRYLAEECIARFGRQMVDTEINRAILIQALKQKDRSVAQEDVNLEIERAAKAYGYVDAQGNVDINRWLKFVTQNDDSKIDFYVEDEVWPSVALKKLVADKVQVTEDDMKKGFEANFGPRVEVLACLFDDDRRALEVWKMASANLTKEFFGKLANKYSIEPASRSNFGEVPPIQKHGGRPELEQEAFRLQPGELSKVVQVGEHWVIMLCLGHTNPRVSDFDAVKEELRDSIYEKKLTVEMADEFERLRKTSQIDNFLAGTSQPGARQVRAGQNQNPGGGGQPAQPRR